MTAMQQVDNMLDDPNLQCVGNLGSGQFGTVCKYRWQHGPTESLVFAVKFINTAEVPDFKYLRFEALNQRQLQHPNILRLLHVGLTRNKDHLYLVLEYADGGDLAQYLERRFAMTHRALSEPEAKYLLKQVVAGLDYVHRKGVANRDVKLANMLLMTSPHARGDGSVYDYVVKIADFGYCKRTDTRSVPRTHVGTQAYMAPEVLAAAVLSEGEAYEYSGEAADMWSIGVSLYVMLFNKQPFEMDMTIKNPDNRTEKFFTDVLTARWQLPDNAVISQECHDLLVRLLEPEPKQRATMQEVMDHAWFAGEARRYVDEINASQQQALLQGEGLLGPAGACGGGGGALRLFRAEQTNEEITALIWEAECRVGETAE